MSITALVTLSNLAFWLLWLMLELRRRRRGVIPELPFSVVLIIIAVNALPFDNMWLFRLGAFVALLTSIHEARLFVRVGAPEVSLAGALTAGGFSALALVYWAVITINQHLNLAIG